MLIIINKIEKNFNVPNLGRTYIFANIMVFSFYVELKFM